MLCKKRGHGYIEKLDAQLAQQQKVQEEMEALSTQNVGLNIQIEEQDARIAELEEQLAQKDQKLQEAQEQTFHLSNTITQLGNEKLELQNQISSLEEAVQFHQGQTASSCRKIRRWEKNAKCQQNASQEIGDAILEARTIAKQMVDNAEARARSITHNAKLAVKKMAEEISDFQEDLDALKKNIQDNTRSMEVRLASISEAVKETQTSFLSRFQEQKEQDKMDEPQQKQLSLFKGLFSSPSYGAS